MCTVLEGTTPQTTKTYAIFCPATDRCCATNRRSSPRHRSMRLHTALIGDPLSDSNRLAAGATWGPTSSHSTRPIMLNFRPLHTCSTFDNTTAVGEGIIRYGKDKCDCHRARRILLPKPRSEMNEQLVQTSLHAKWVWLTRARLGSNPCLPCFRAIVYIRLAWANHLAPALFPSFLALGRTLSVSSCSCGIVILLPLHLLHGPSRARACFACYCL